MVCVVPHRLEHVQKLVEGRKGREREHWRDHIRRRRRSGGSKGSAHMGPVGAGLQRGGQSGVPIDDFKKNAAVGELVRRRRRG